MPLWGIEKKRQPNNDWYPRLVQNRNSNDSVCRHCFQHCCLMIAIKTIDITIILMMLVFFQVVRMCNNRNGNSNKDHSSTTMMLIYIYIYTHTHTFLFVYYCIMYWKQNSVPSKSAEVCCLWIHEMRIWTDPWFHWQLIFSWQLSINF